MTLLELVAYMRLARITIKNTCGILHYSGAYKQFYRMEGRRKVYLHVWRADDAFFEAWRKYAPVLFEVYHQTHRTEQRNRV